MKNLLMTTAFAIALTGPAFAAGSHSGGHDDDHADKHAEMMAAVSYTHLTLPTSDLV